VSSDKTLISVVMITFGHEAYIKQAIEGVLMQKCDFEVELIVSNDFSPDNTDEVVQNIIETHANGSWIKYIKHYPNKGIPRNFVWSLQKGRGKYIAVCEGDDYWTDPFKLQKQVKFLENNPSYSMTFNSSSEIDENGNEFKIAKYDTETIDLATVLKKGWFIRTASLVFRRVVIEDGFPNFFINSYSTDYILQVMILKNGLGKNFFEVMSVYRHHQGGISQASKKLQIERWIKKLELLDTLNSFTDGKYSKEVKQNQKTIKENISFYLFRYPSLIVIIDLRTYFKFGNVWLFFREGINRIKLRVTS
jgi:glycosyltransferase involved in cell wall biosynthesis